MEQLQAFQNYKNDVIEGYILDNSDKKELLLSLELYGDNIKFNDNIWNCNKKMKSQVHKNEVQIYFNSIPLNYRELVKYYAITSLNFGVSAAGTNNKVKYISKLLNFLNTDNIEILKINKLAENEFFKYLKANEEYSERYKKSIWGECNEFLKFIRTWDNVALPRALFSKNPFSGNIKKDSKYIPDYVVRQLDKVMKNKEVARYLYEFYWIARSIPSRASEVLGMKLNCLKPYGNDTWVVFIPTWKQNGGYEQEQLRRVYIHYKGHGKFLIDLIKEQQKYAESLQDKLPEELKGYLFVHQREIFNSKEFAKSGNVSYYISPNEYILPTRSKLRTDLNKLCKRFNIVDENGKIYAITSHQLRHNGITNMIYAGFTPMKIMLITAHQGTAMITKSYTHIKNDILVEKQKKVLGEQVIDDDAPVLFRGRILKMNDAALESRLLKNVRAYKIKDMGICSDITGCKSGIFDCLDCSYFVPDADSLNYFKDKVIFWEQRVKMFEKNTSLKENAEYNLKLHKGIVERIVKAIGGEQNG